MSSGYTHDAMSEREEIILELATITSLMALELLVAGAINPSSRRLVTQAKEAAIRAAELCPNLRESLGYKPEMTRNSEN